MKLFTTLAVSLSLLVVSSTASLLNRRAAIQPSVDPTAIPLSPTGGGTYPRLAIVQGGILAAYKVLDNGVSTLLISKSTDGGKSYSAWGSVTSGTANIDNPDLIQLPNGHIVCTYRNHDLNSSGDFVFYRITASVSTDGGRTWSFLSQVDQRPASKVTKNGIWVWWNSWFQLQAIVTEPRYLQEPFNRISTTNALQVYYASENSNIDQDILMRTSTDNGASWSKPITVAGGTTVGRDGMPGCTSFPRNPSKVLCVFETTQGTGSLFTVKSVVSNDDGATWGERSQVYVPTGNGNNGAFGFFLFFHICWSSPCVSQLDLLRWLPRQAVPLLLLLWPMKIRPCICGKYLFPCRAPPHSKAPANIGHVVGLSMELISKSSHLKLPIQPFGVKKLQFPKYNRVGLECWR